MSDIVDISVSLSAATPVWPGNDRVAVVRTHDMASGDDHTESTLAMNVHTGTHVDAPLHFLVGGAAVDELPLDVLLGACIVVDVGEERSVTAALLERLVPAGATRLLCRTRNSRLWAAGDTTFHEDFVALTHDAAEWVASHGVRLLGVDYLSVQRFSDSNNTHRTLLAAGVVILEGVDLSGASPGAYDLICLPLRLGGAEGAPARAVLRRVRQG